MRFKKSDSGYLNPNIGSINLKGPREPGDELYRASPLLIQG
jgi:hypothetical protein